MLGRRNKLLLLKLLSLFSVVRGYNVLVIVVAQYLVSIYILASDKPLRHVIFDGNLLAIVVASALAIASGYIINNFYDAEKDLINRPRKTTLDQFISQRIQLATYFVLNFLSVVFASYVSFRAVVFFSAYIFGIWLYSHRIKKLPFMGNIISAALAITPFFAVFIYYKNFDFVIFVHATFLFFILLIREFIKDLENIQGDLLHNYNTVPIRYGEKLSKIISSVLAIFTIVLSGILIFKFQIGYMYFYFYTCVFLLLLFIILLWRAKTKLSYIILHNMLKFIVVTGVFSILLLNVDLVLNRIL